MSGLSCWRWGKGTRPTGCSWNSLNLLALASARNDVEQHDQSLPAFAAQVIEHRRREIASKRVTLAASGIPVGRPAQAGRDMEKSPKTHAEMGEGDRRQVLLLALNNTHRVLTAAGAFNVNGKTTCGSATAGNNPFIVERKIWGGAKEFAAARSARRAPAVRT